MDEKTFNQIVSEIVKTLQNGSVQADFAPKGEIEQEIISRAVIQETVPKSITKETKVEAEPFIQESEANDVIETVVEKGDGLLLKNPADLGALVRMKAHTSARIGVGKAGARLKTETMLSLRADHAAARDAVFTDVDENILKEMNLKTFKTVCKDKDEFLTRPDLGKKFSDEELKAIVAEAGEGADVLIYASDGLSSTAINANIKNILPVLEEGLKLKNLKVAKPFYVKFGRVGAEDAIAEATKAKVICVLIGERPGLATAESMSAYIAYNATVGMPEARRTVVSNIHKGGTMAIEAGAYITDIIEQIYNAKASGVEFKKQGDVI